jgi:nucleoside-diphosphate-sugar epimerase
MADVSRPTAFVTGAAGFIGNELVKVLVDRGFRVFGLARSSEAAQKVQRAGAITVRGDLLVPGQWQDEAAADWVFHIPPYAPATGRFNRSRVAAAIASKRALMDKHLLDAVADGPTRRIVCLVDSRCYGSTGSRPVTEDESPAFSAGHCSPAAFDRLDAYALAGLPILTAIPGCVYGNGSWFREHVIDPVIGGRRVLQFGATGPWVTPIHVHDCARALVHLAEHGEIGSRYFLGNTETIQMREFASGFARVASRPLRVWRIPPAAARLVVGLPLADYVQSNAAFSNIRLRGIGFRFRYPTIEQGLEQIIGALHE